MKKRIFKGVLCVLLAAAGIVTGINIQKHTVNEVKAAEISQDKIALVNLDSGYSKKDGDVVNYSNELIEKGDYEYVSYQQARDGVASGKYAAYIVIPEDFSKAVESINTKPKAAELEYQINGSLDKASNTLAANSIANFEKDLEYKVSYLYLTTILSEFQSGQEAAKKVLENDKKDLEALKSVDTINLVANTKFEQVPEAKKITAPLDVTEEKEKNKASLDKITNSYKNTADETDKTINEVIGQVKSLDTGEAPKSDLEAMLTTAYKEDGSADNDFTELMDKIAEETIKQGQQKFSTYNGQIYIVDTQDLISVGGKNYVNFDSAKKLSFQKTEPSEGEYLFEEKGQVTAAVDKETKEKQTEFRTQIKQEQERVVTGVQDHVKKEAETIAKNVETARTKLQENVFSAEAQTLEKAKSDITASNSSITAKASENAKSSAQSGEKAIKAAQDYSRKMYESVQKAKDKSDKKVEEGLKQAKDTKSTSASKNKKNLSSFTAKLPNSKLNKGQNGEYKEQVAAPVISSGQELAQAAQPQAVQSESQNFDPWLILNGALILLLILGIAFYYFAVIHKSGTLEEISQAREVEYESSEDEMLLFTTEEEMEYESEPGKGDAESQQDQTNESA